MIEHKYRAWHKRRKKYYKVLHLHLDSPEGIWATVEGFDVIEQKPIHMQIQPKDIIVEHYIGQTDKKNVEIYEGDLVQVQCAKGHHDGRLITGEVYYNDYNSFSRFEMKFDVEGNSYKTDCIDKCCRVVGNKHEGLKK